ncbi:MAG: hypothetical protein QM598_00960 [Protaetiibacter sp.]
MSMPQQSQPPSAQAPNPYAAGASSAEAARNPLALASFAAGIAAVALGVVSQLTTMTLLRAGGYQVYALVSGVFSVLVLLAGIAALVLGLVAAQRPGSRLRAGMGIGIGTAVCVSVFVGFAVGGILGLG